MITRARAGISKPNPIYADVATAAEPPAAPTSVRAALRDDDWRRAVHEEYDALLRNDTWRLVS